MSMIRFKKDPAGWELAVFGSALAVVPGAIGATLWLLKGWQTAAWSVWGAGAAALAVFAVVPAARRPIYLGWMYATLPIGWVLAHVALGLVYFLVMTPIGLAIRLLGKDPMDRRPDPGAASYWRARRPTTDPKRYFRQF